MKFRQNLDNNLEKIQTKFRQIQTKFRRNLEEIQTIIQTEFRQYLDVFQTKLDKIQTMLEKFRACPKLTKFRQNLDMSEKIQTKFRQIQNLP